MGGEGRGCVAVASFEPRRGRGGEEERRRGAGARRSWRRSSDGIGMAASTPPPPDDGGETSGPSRVSRRALSAPYPGKRSC